MQKYIDLARSKSRKSKKKPLTDKDALAGQMLVSTACLVLGNCLLRNVILFNSLLISSTALPHIATVCLAPQFAYSVSSCNNN